MKILKNIAKFLFYATLVIIFPVGILYALAHTLGKEPATFVGGIVLFALGFITAYFIYNPTQFNAIFGNIVTFFKNIA